jgi:hypothetical protein
LEQGIFSLSPVEATDRATGKRQASDRQATSKIERYNDRMNKEYICRESDEILKSIWEAAPQRGRQHSGKDKLKTAWLEIPAADRPSQETILGALKAWSDSHAWKKDGGQYIPAIHNWIKDRKWENIPTNQTASPQLEKLTWE